METSLKFYLFPIIAIIFIIIGGVLTLYAHGNILEKHKIIINYIFLTIGVGAVIFGFYVFISAE